MANIYYELGWMHAWGRETVVVKVGDLSLPSDLVRTEHIPYDAHFSRRFKEFVDSLQERCDYYTVLADQLERNPLLAIDYLRRAYLLNGDKRLRKKNRHGVFGSGARKPLRRQCRTTSRAVLNP